MLARTWPINLKGEVRIESSMRSRQSREPQVEKDRGMLARHRGNKGRRAGASSIEMAIIAPVFVTLILGQIESARLGMVAQLLTTAAREGCRVAVISGKTQADVQSRVNSVLTGSGIAVGTVTPSPSNWT